MPFFQNPFDVDWSGVWILSDHTFFPKFKIGPNRNTADWMVAWTPEPYNCSTNNTLTINYAFDPNFVNYASLAINVAGATPSATLASEVCAALNSNAIFSELWLAQPLAWPKGGVLGAAIPGVGVNTINSPNKGTAIDTPSPGPGGPYTVAIKSVKRPKQSMRVYISNTSAELAMTFNLKAPVTQLPNYFARHTIANRFTFSDCTANLVELNTSLPSDQQVITNAGLDYTMVELDWQFLLGRSDVFKCFVNTYNVSNKILTQIEYYTGASVGDLAIKTYYTYDGSGNLINQASIPYVLTSGDLLSPPGS